MPRPFTSETGRAAAARIRPETHRRAAAARWTPDARVRAAVKQLVDNAPALSPDQLDHVRDALAPVLAAEASGSKRTRGRAA